jgi:YXWGXW repeat-containing protein
MRTISFIRSSFFALFLLSVPVASFAQIGISVNFGPPPLPVYEQPICPGDGYIWTPGYWAWDGDDYYWVPGTWVLVPEVGFFWTPGYWGWGGSAFFFHEGYWGPHVGFYGGINYGFGYFGHGYEGGRWESGHFFYNRSVNNVNINEVHNVYNTRIENYNSDRVSFNGGNGGINERANSQEEAYARERHIPPVAAQTQHVQAARGNRELRASVNQGKPSIAATSRPGAFHDPGVVSAREAGGRYEPPANRGTSNANRPPTAIHPRELPPIERPTAPNTGNPKLDQKYQQQQEKLYSKQDQERQKLQQKQEQEHQRLSQQNANEAKNQQVEQRHQQQTQQLQQRHVQQQQQLQQKQQPQRQPEGRPAHH